MNNPGISGAPPTVHTPESKKKKSCKAKTANGTGADAAAKRGRKKKPADDKKLNKKKFGKKGVTVTSQAREIVYNVIKHFKKEAQNKCNSHPFENWLKRSVAATGLSKSTLQRIIKEAERPVVKPMDGPMDGVKSEVKDELAAVGVGPGIPPPHPPPTHHMPPSLETVKLEQYEQGLIKHFTSNFMHHNMHHHHPMAQPTHHPELLLQPIHHVPMAPPPQPPTTLLSHPHNPQTHIHL